VPLTAKRSYDRCWDSLWVNDDIDLIQKVLEKSENIGPISSAFNKQHIITGRFLVPCL
jgi:hypothetical protein